MRFLRFVVVPGRTFSFNGCLFCRVAGTLEKAAISAPEKGFP